MNQFALNEDQIAVRDMARDFAAEKIAPHAVRWDEEKHFPVDVMREAAALGIGGVYIRDDVGGSALTRAKYTRSIRRPRTRSTTMRYDPTIADSPARGTRPNVS